MINHVNVKLIIFDHLLTCVIRNIGSPSDLEKLINIFETDHEFKLKLQIEVPDWSKGGKLLFFVYCHIKGIHMFYTRL